MKIVIVGGGTAGWLSAMYACRFNEFSKNEIIVIESSKIPIIGAGEGSTGVLTRVMNTYFTKYGINEIDFLNNTEAILKLGINFKDWNGIGTSYISPIEPTLTVDNNVDLEALSFKIKNRTHDSVLAGYLLKRGLSDFRKNHTQHVQNHAYHFDAHKVGQYLKSLCIKQNTRHIVEHITQINKDENGNIKNVQLESGKMVEGDLFIDCSGFSRLLVKEMDMGWESYAEYLPVNSALPYLHPYEENEQIMPETLAWAQKNGWMWQIPTQTRYGCGYVYCDAFVNADTALQELQETTGRKITPIRNLKFEVGRVKQFWKKNVIAIGLSSTFLEPLQATSIHTTLMQIQMMTNYLSPKKKCASDIEITLYNNYAAKMIDEFKDLIQIHYMTHREDTEFWKFIKHDLKKTEKTKTVLEVAKHRALSFIDFEMYHGAAAWGVWGWTLLGLDIITNDVALSTIKKHAVSELIDSVIKDVTREYEKQATTMLTNTELIQLFKNKKFDAATFNKQLQSVQWPG